VNSGKKKSRIIEENISIKEWEKQFLGLLERADEKGADKKIGEKRRLEGDQEVGLEDEEIELQLKKLKKATGVDGIVGEV